ncbi:MAG: S1/P1 nuclease [Flammeovirgaceae bacterium]
MRRLIAVMLFLGLPFGASAWWAQGHMVVAALAYLELDKSQQEQVTSLLKQHPEYERLWKREYAKYRKKMDLGVFLMMRASVWADEIKNRKHPYNEESHGNWHYVTYKVKFPNNHETNLPDGTKEPNVVWAIQETQKKVFNQEMDKAQRAISLAWLIHLVGDIHQPLHCGSEFSDEYPKGDRGGNDQYVKPKRKAIKLHGLWDSALGRKSKLRKAIQQAKLMQKANANMNFPKEIDPVAWSKESFNYVLSDVHQHGKFPTSSDKSNAPKVAKSYLTNMKTLAVQQGTKAGVRLAESVKGLKL